MTGVAPSEKPYRKRFGNHQVTTGQAAQMLGVSSRTVSKWIDEGKFPSWRINKDRRVLITDLAKFAEARGIPLNIDNPVCAVKVDLGNKDMKNQMESLNLRMDALSALVSLAEECLSKGTLMLGDSRMAKVDVDARKRFLDRLKLFRSID